MLTWINIPVFHDKTISNFVKRTIDDYKAMNS